MRCRSNNRGFTLVASVMLITFAALVVVSITVFIFQRLTLIDTKKVRAAAIDLAHAGVHGAIYSYRVRALAGNGFFPTIRFNVDAQNYFVIGGDEGDLLMVDVSNASLSGNNRRLLNVEMQNATNSASITIEQMIVSWTGVPSPSSIRRIRIDNSWVWQGNEPSGTLLDIDDVTLDTVPSTIDINRINFGQNMSTATITAQFIMSDGSIRELQLFPATQNFNFTAKVTGQTTYSPIYRTLDVDYNALTGRIYNYDEITTQIIP